MKKIRIFNGMSLRTAKKVAKGLECKVEYPKCSGHVRFAHEQIEYCVLHNNHNRKDASRELVSFLKKVEFIVNGPSKRRAA